MNPKMPDIKTRGTNTVVIKKYRGLGTVLAIRQAAKDVSDNGRCWWIENFIIKNSIQKWKGGRHR